MVSEEFLFFFFMSLGFCVGYIMHEYLKHAFILMRVCITFINQLAVFHRIVCMDANDRV